VSIASVYNLSGPKVHIAGEMIGGDGTVVWGWGRLGVSARSQIARVSVGKSVL
jgi:hypothetical protein